MIGVQKNFNGSSDLTTPYEGCFATVVLCTKFEVSVSSLYKDMKGSVENGVVWSSHGSVKLTGNSIEHTYKSSC